ncbi:MAG: ATP-binding protein, partial [Vicinamibacterales bacterium]
VTTKEQYGTLWARLNQGESIRELLVNRTREGQLISVEVSVNPIRGSLDEIVGFLAVERDVSQRVLADVAITRSEERYRALAETATDEIFIVNAENRFEYINASAARHARKGDVPPLGRHLVECFGPELGARFQQRIEQVRSSQLPVYEEAQIHFPSGTRWMGTWLHPIGAADGCWAGDVMGIARDTTVQHKLAELLERQNLLLTSVIDASPVGVMLLSAGTWVCDIANAALRGFGAERLDAAVTLADGWPEAVAQLVPALDQALHSVVPVTIDLSLAGTTPGPLSARRFTVSASRLQLADRGPSVLVMLTEITERVQLEGQLIQAQKMEAIGRLAGGIAHDFNNLLTPILGYSDLVLNSLAADDQRREDVEEVCRAARSASALTSQLLTFSRKQVTDPVVVTLNSVLTDVEKLVRRSIGEDVDVVQQHAPDLGLIRADRNQLEQVVMNLSVNARDAMPNGGVLTIATANRRLEEPKRSTRRHIPPGDYVVLSVTDTGTGMTPEVLGHLFEPFYTTKEFGKGTGLGLSTVFGIVSQSGGYVSVASELGEGTTFTMFFPRVEAGVMAGNAADRFSVGALPRGTESILIVEDNDALRRLAHRVLSDLGYTTFLASNADEALRIGNEYSGRVHLMLTDIVMPGADGITLSRRMAVQHPDVRVLFMSGYSGRDLAERHAHAERIRLLQKPFTRETLARAVRAALGDHVLAPALPAA